MTIIGYFFFDKYIYRDHGITCIFLIKKRVAIECIEKLKIDPHCFSLYQCVKNHCVACCNFLKIFFVISLLLQLRKNWSFLRNFNGLKTKHGRFLYMYPVIIATVQYYRTALTLSQNYNRKANVMCAKCGPEWLGKILSPAIYFFQYFFKKH